MRTQRGKNARRIQHIEFIDTSLTAGSVTALLFVNAQKQWLCHHNGFTLISTQFASKPCYHREKNKWWWATIPCCAKCLISLPTCASIKMNSEDWLYYSLHVRYPLFSPKMFKMFEINCVLIIVISNEMTSMREIVFPLMRKSVGGRKQKRSVWLWVSFFSLACEA